MFKKALDKKIVFQSAMPEFDIAKPKPATRFTPEWFRKMPGVIDGIETVKKCVPFLDAIGSGYIIELTADVYFDRNQNEFATGGKIDIVSKHFADQMRDFPTPDGYDSQPYKWINHWKVQTPKGYSCLFIHPINTPSLPFYSLTGVVDTDLHPVIVNFPFLLKQNFEGVIPAGTPLIQIIPFKRDNWYSEVIDDKPIKFPERVFEFTSPPFSWYKRNYWTKKFYK
jgi:hypothetical protein